MAETAPDAVGLQEDAPATPQPRVSPFLPCLLTWLLPGLGHLYLGKKDRGVAFLLVVLAMFAFGLASGGTSSLIDPQQPLSYLATFDNLALGPLDLVARTASVGGLVYRLPAEESDPRRAALMTHLRERVRHPTYEYGNTFLLTAGLMNLLLLLDAFDISMGRKG